MKKEDLRAKAMNIPSLSAMMQIVEKTIGFDLERVKPMSDEEYREWAKVHETHHKDPYESAVDYTPTTVEIVQIAELLNRPVDDIKDYTYRKFIDVNGIEYILVCTPRAGWLALCGREWKVNLNTNEVKLIRIS